MMISAVTMRQLEDFLETIQSKHTRKNYVNGIKKFEDYYGDSITKLIKNPEATKTVEKFYVALKQKHPQNTCRNVTNAVIQFLKYFGTDVRPRKALGIYRTEVSTDDHKLTIDELQRMATVADLKEQVTLEVLLLGLRIGDSITLKTSDLDKLEQETPIELKLRATKEGTVYETFISQEFKELLQLYLPTVKGKWLFQGIRKDSHAKDETLNLTLKNLASRAGIQLHGRLHWHCGRKLVMRTGAELGISPWIVKKM
jgi:integrase